MSDKQVHKKNSHNVLIAHQTLCSVDLVQLKIFGLLFRPYLAHIWTVGVCLL